VRSWVLLVCWWAAGIIEKKDVLWRGASCVFTTFSTV